nr:hypothetical protein CFP56_20058 [Quercus suber]
MRRQKCPSKGRPQGSSKSRGGRLRNFNTGRSSTNGFNTRSYLLHSEEQGRGIVKMARPSVRMDEPSS